MPTRQICARRIPDHKTEEPVECVTFASERDTVGFRMSLIRPLGRSDRDHIRANLDKYFETTGEHYGFNTYTTVFELFPSTKTAGELTNDRLMEVLKFLAPGKTFYLKGI